MLIQLLILLLAKVSLHGSIQISEQSEQIENAFWVEIL